jgi:anthranilate 1,2-dioxygenase (deaminating, decarboxylating) large subunit
MRRISAVVSALLLVAGAAQAYDQPTVNLGLTSFLDGAPPAGPGFYFAQYGQYYHTQRFTDENGDRVKPAPDVDVWASLSQLLYQSNQPLLLDGKWGLDLIVPLVDFKVKKHGLPVGVNDGVLGDIVIGPYLQWDPIIQNGRPVFVQRFELQIIAPTGNFDEDKDLNPGSGLWPSIPTGPQRGSRPSAANSRGGCTICGAAKTRTPSFNRVKRST